MARACIGTSGWHYAHWAGPFYPEGLKTKDYLAYYAGRFATAEINATFYRLPPKETLAAWRGATPPDFTFAVKASRYITHMKKLKDPKQSTRKFFRAIGALGDKLGPVLFQLPPKWRANPARLEAFLAALPSGRRYAFEFRDSSWFGEEVVSILDRAGAAFCVYDLAGRPCPTISTGRFDYIRLHGPGGEAYRGRYSGRALDQWAGWIKSRLEQGRDVYCYFDNDQAGHAPRDALRLKERVEG